ncbi:MAG: RsmG family class I SAM-dependent methyltransferase [Armatimonadota bacterium]
MDDALSRFVAFAGAIGLSPTPGQLEALRAGAAWLARASTASGISQYASPEDALIRAMGPALAYFPVNATPRQGRLADIGSGTGAIGATIALFAPTLEVDLVDRAKRAYTVSELLVAKMDLPNARPLLADVTALESRYDAVVFRALGRAPVALSLALPLVRPGGIVCAYHRRGDMAFEAPDAALAVLETRDTPVEELVLTCYRR